MFRKEPLGRKIFVVFNYLFCCLLAVLCVIPIVHIFAISLSDHIAVESGAVGLWPVDFTLDSYLYIVQEGDFFKAMGVSVIRVILGVTLGMIVTVLAGYPLSKKKQQFHARPLYVWLIMITMIVSGGLIPKYLVIANLGLMDSIWALVLPAALNPFNIILLQNYIKTLPDEIMEAAYVDGAGHWKNLFLIVLPLSKPVLATLVLFVAVSHWNAWFDGLIYMNRPEHYPLQSYLQTIVTEIDPTLVQNQVDALANVTQKGSKSAQIFLAMLPILCVYPFLQKYFAGGIVMGSVKG